MVENLVQSAKTRARSRRRCIWRFSRVFQRRDELKIAENYFQSGKVNKREATLDLAWALINSDGVSLPALTSKIRQSMNMQPIADGDPFKPYSDS